MEWKREGRREGGGDAPGMWSWCGHVGHPAGPVFLMVWFPVVAVCSGQSHTPQHEATGDWFHSPLKCRLLASLAGLQGALVTLWVSALPLAACKLSYTRSVWGWTLGCWLSLGSRGWPSILYWRSPPSNSSQYFPSNTRTESRAFNFLWLSKEHCTLSLDYSALSPWSFRDHGEKRLCDS